MNSRAPLGWSFSFMPDRLPSVSCHARREDIEPILYGGDPGAEPQKKQDGQCRSKLDASRSNGVPPYGMGPHARALERDAPNGRGDPPGRPYEAAMVATARNGEVAITS